MMKKLILLFLVIISTSTKFHAQTPYIGEIRMFAGNFAPQGWAFCDGSLLNIGDNETLFNLIGTTYGGDGISTFAVPDLRGRNPIGVSSAYPLGQMSGTENVTLTINQLPVHNHNVNAVTVTGDQNAATGNLPADTKLWDKGYSDVAPTANIMNNGMIGNTGQSQPVDILKPYLTVSYIISLYGIYPSQN